MSCPASSGRRSTLICNRIKAVDIVPLQQVVHLLEFDDSGGVCAHVTKVGSVAPPEFHALVRSLGLGGQPHRQFCRKLLPHQGIDPHVDAWIKERGLELRRFQVPITSHPDIVMRWPDDGVEVHLEPGWLYEVDVTRMHEVVNNTDSERIHLQIDQIGATI